MPQRVLIARWCGSVAYSSSLANQRAVGGFLPASVEPRHHFAFEEAAQASL
jgi:hypothetical protein